MEMRPVDLDFCKKIPKVELHAHLNGSISQPTLQKLYKKQKESKNIEFNEEQLCCLSGKESYTKAFQIFQLLHTLVSDIEAVTLITEDVINEFYLDNVYYLELRSTPKKLPSSSKEEYIEAIVKVIEERMNSYDDLVVTYLVSIDRGRSVNDAIENIELAVKYNKLFPDVVVGVDFSGNPSVGDVNDFIPILEVARKNGLKVITHIGEVKDEKENLTLLEFQSDRVGHAVFIHPSHGGSEILFQELRKHVTPIEICLSSNIIGGIVPSFSKHPVKEWYMSNHPIVFCTDDKGLFNSCLSDEYMKAADILKLSRNDMWKLTEASIQYISASDKIKEKLYKLWKYNKSQLNV